MATCSNNQNNNQVQTDLVLDLNDVSNIGHPYFEHIDPKPDIHKLFNRFHKMFFDDVNDFPSLVKLEWCNDLRNSTGEAHLASQRSDRISILLNKNLLRNRLRKEIIEQLLHEMIHAYLMVKHMEDSSDKSIHGSNFITKMSEINHLAKLNIAAHHNIPTEKRTSNAAVDDRDKRYMWRCRGNCCSQPPYFGYIWIDDEKREPQIRDNMWIDSELSNCEHIFERYKGTYNSKHWLSVWECVDVFHEHIAKEKIHIKFEGDISDAHYINYDYESNSFTSVDEFLPELYGKECANGTVCMICLDKITKCRLHDVIEHLNACSGLQFGIRIDKTLPILKIQQ